MWECVWMGERERVGKVEMEVEGGEIWVRWDIVSVIMYHLQIFVWLNINWWWGMEWNQKQAREEQRNDSKKRTCLLLCIPWVSTSFDNSKRHPSNTFLANHCKNLLNCTIHHTKWHRFSYTSKFRLQKSKNNNPFISFTNNHSPFQIHILNYTQYGIYHPILISFQVLQFPSISYFLLQILILRKINSPK